MNVRRSLRAYLFSCDDLLYIKPTFHDLMLPQWMEINAESIFDQSENHHVFTF